MDIGTLVTGAVQGDRESFNRLYNNTYYNMYYLALKYVKNESDAEAVIRESYQKAYGSLSSLRNPNSFSSWLSSIVAGTSLEFIRRKNPLVFSGPGTVESDNSTYEAEDDNAAVQPGNDYSSTEIKYLSEELLECLSDEQRMCVLMYHFDGQSIDSVSGIIGCSQNTVKAKLNYGRINLRKKLEEFKALGYRVYGDAPIPFLMFVLKAEKNLPGTQQKAILAMDRLNPLGSANAEENASENRLGSTNAVEHAFTNPNTENVQHVSETEYAVNQGEQERNGKKTVNTKVIAAVLSFVVVGGTAAAIAFSANGRKDSAPISEDVSVSEKITKPGNKVYSEKNENIVSNQENETEEGRNSGTAENSDEYTDIIGGNLNEAQLELVLGRISDDCIGDEVDGKFAGIFNYLCTDLRNDKSGKYAMACLSEESDVISSFYGEDINRLFASFSDYVINEENFTFGEYTESEDGDILSYIPAAVSTSANAEITQTIKERNMMLVFYTYSYHSDGKEQDDFTEERLATLTPGSDGLFRIIKVETLTDDSEEDMGSTVQSGNDE